VKRKNWIYDLASSAAKTGGAGIGARLGTYAAVSYAVGKEVYTIVMSSQIYPLPSLALESLALVGSCALLGRGAVGYLLKRLGGE
jgi:hypothetical protein